jgi:hypothetical protein
MPIRSTIKHMTMVLHASLRRHVAFNQYTIAIAEYLSLSGELLCLPETYQMKTVACATLETKSRSEE